MFTPEWDSSFPEHYVVDLKKGIAFYFMKNGKISEQSIDGVGEQMRKLIKLLSKYVKKMQYIVLYGKSSKTGQIGE